MHARIAKTRTEYLLALRVLYESYRRQGYTAPNPARIRFSPHLGFPTSRTLVYLSRPRRLLGTLSVVGDSRRGVPADVLFRAELDHLRVQGRRLAEATGFAIVPGHQQMALSVFFELTRLLVQYCYWSRYDDIVIAVHPKQARFYEEVFAFEKFTDCRPHPYVMGAPAVGLRLDLTKAHRVLKPEVCRRYLHPRIPTSRLQVPPMSRKDLVYFSCLVGLDPEADGEFWEPPQRIAA